MVKQIKVLQTLVLFACRFSIDIKVFQTFTPRSAYRRARACPAPCVLLLDHITSVGQDRLILPCSGSGEPELQGWAQCLSVFALQGGIHPEAALGNTLILICLTIGYLICRLMSRKIDFFLGSWCRHAYSAHSAKPQILLDNFFAF